jgi:hypothetical protein
MPNLSPPPLSERLPIAGDKNSGFFAEMPFAWCKWFVGLVDNDQNVEPRAYTTATLPAASQHTGKIIFVSDAASGAKFQGSDGTSWVNLG